MLVGALEVQQTQYPINGTYRELIAQVQLTPPALENVRQFVFHYDAVLHQLVTHKIMVSIRQDWVSGQLAEDAPSQIGIIELDIVYNWILPLSVNLEKGSFMTGFQAMVELGIRHIGEGTDCLLFLLVLLLPAPLLVSNGRWGQFGGVRYSLRHLLLIVTAFTIGHSLPLLFGTLEWFQFPSQPVEVLIALSILLSAAHALRPLFPGREPWVAASFGLIHGLAFADTLTNLHLETGPLLWSLFGGSNCCPGDSLAVFVKPD
ncbi:HupE/UreJ family protein [Rhodocytophaga rosea]|uniref:HupE/UreJ family protein n=1 Tax=Rhodocytophaga rosea TaxID=2704465 RepID=UPI001E3BE4D4|nr:HupE/UreJ family protein [Rhodocytophaga rosea]